MRNGTKWETGVSRQTPNSVAREGLAVDVWDCSHRVAHSRMAEIPVPARSPQPAAVAESVDSLIPLYLHEP